MNGNEVQDFIGSNTSEYIAENLESIRGRLRAVTGSVRIDAVGDWEIWASETTAKIQVRHLTKVVMAPMPYRYGPECVQEWLRTCAKESKEVKPTKEVYDWLWESGLKP